MTPINYHGKKFRPVSSSSNSQTNKSTLFKYFQEGQIVWAQYEGGNILKGHLIGLVAADGSIDMRYHHVDYLGHLQTGICHSTPEIQDNGKIVLHESWQWTSGDGSTGQSTVVEI